MSPRWSLALAVPTFVVLTGALPLRAGAGATYIAGSDAAYKLAHKVRTSSPGTGRRRRTNLGVALRTLGTRTRGVKGDDLLAQSAADNLTLEVCNHDELHGDGVMSQRRLVLTLAALGRPGDGAAAVRMLSLFNDYEIVDLWASPHEDQFFRYDAARSVFRAASGASLTQNTA